VKLVECWIGSGALKENPEDVASAVLGPGWLNEKPAEVEGLESVVVWPNAKPVDGVVSAGFAAANVNPLFELSGAFVFVLNANPPLVLWLVV
jgi:hypothetical protein